MKKKYLKILFFTVLLLGTNFLTAKFVMDGYAFNGSTKYLKIKALEEIVKKNYLYSVTDKDLETGELKGVVAGLNDPYSEYYTKEEYDKLMEYTTGKFYGIGVVITKGEDNLITVISPIKDSPADKAGIKAKDKIIKVENVEYTGDKITEATQVMKGKKGTKVKITVYSPETNKTKDLEIIRDEIVMQTIIKHKIGQVGYIGITQFDEGTAKDFKLALEDLKSQNIKSLIIDLRGNPGGIVDSAAEIADLLLPKGMIVYAENKNKDRVFEFKSDENYLNMPMAVLINEGSASASEILAGAIRDYDAGIIIGKKSFGKGIVQTATRFPTGDGIKLTTSEYFSPKGINIHKIGIKPDIEVDLDKNSKGIGYDYLDTDSQLKRAIDELNKK